ncbi:outer membrane beta-barrel protein [Mucilaginibacter polytrichastri]|uniref:Outer membrane protein beta-barrel domain-containing protein n=1 Tax=Mucilaginibacter polytrichastri TaxID=1302689 RepID=A0A1Q6A059_9SPHI|nr:outer membrane beta-barrel protein [Mucilaginibacter polytrichastri]OKS87400.1 hypothetical protein RG47T_2861 [Mucilaginibacter polytrichastri]SFT22247.1 Outer membrane protein beta-barrel family protein [Mucilaginibacter polytrichastri]
MYLRNSFFSFFFCLAFIFPSKAQIFYEIKGQLIDTAGKASKGEVINLVDGKDTSSNQTDSHGYFHFNHVKSTKFHFEVRKMLYGDVGFIIQDTAGRHIIKLSPIILKMHANMLKEVIIRAKPIPVKYKKDTIEFDASAYRVNKGARLQALLKMLPGLKINEEGNFVFQSEIVNKIKVNGKEFFSGDINALAAQLPAEIFNKIQLIDDYGTLGNFTGIKTGETQKTLNITTKDGINSGSFGNFSLNGGSDDRRGLSGNGNLWRDMLQTSIGGNLNLAENREGINTGSNAVLSYRNPITEHLNLSTALNYSKMHNNWGITSNSEMVNDQGNIDNSQNSLNDETGKSTILKANLDYRPDPDNFVIISPVFQYHVRNMTSQLASRQQGLINQELRSNDLITSNDRSEDISILAGHNFKRLGILMDMSLQISQNNSGSLENRIDTIHYFGSQKIDSLSNLQLLATNKSTRINYKLSASKLLSANSKLDLVYSYLKWDQNSSLVTEKSDRGVPTEVDSLSQAYQSVIVTQNLNFSYNYNSGKLSASVGAVLQPGSITFSLDDQIAKSRNTYFNIAPLMKVNYLFSESSSLEIKSFSDIIFPTTDQLRPVADVRNPQNTVVGNPDLKPAVNQSINVKYNFFNQKHNQNLSLRAGATLIKNQVVSNILFINDTLNNLKQVTHYLNTNGTYNISIGYNFTAPLTTIGKQALNLDLDGNSVLRKNIFYSEGIKNQGRITNIDQSVRIWINLANLSLSSSVTYNYYHTLYNQTSQIAGNVNTFLYRLRSQVEIAKNFSLNCDASKQVIYGISSAVNTDHLIINAGLAQQFFKNRLTLSFQVNDLFNQGNNLQYYADNNTTTDVTRKSITRFVLLTLSTTLEKFSKR